MCYYFNKKITKNNTLYLRECNAISVKLKYWVKRVRSLVAFARTGKQINILKNCYFKVTIFNGA